MPIMLSSFNSGLEKTVAPITIHGPVTFSASRGNGYTLSINLGAEASDRVLFACVSGAGLDTDALATVSSFTFGGIAATKLLEKTDTLSNGRKTCAALFALSYPTGTSVTCVATFSSTRDGAGFTVFSRYRNNITPQNTNTFYHPGGTAVSTRNIIAPAGGFAIAYTSYYGIIFSNPWTGITGRTVGSGQSLASDSFSSSTLVSASFDSNLEASMILASFA